MASMVFKREVGKGEPERSIRFDSEPKRSICMAFGFQQEGFALELESEDTMRRVYKVHAASTKDGKPQLIGRLTAKTKEAIWAGQ